MKTFAERPHLGGRPAVRAHDEAVEITSHKTGYTTQIDVAALGGLALRHGLSIHVAVLPGAMMHPARTLFHVEGHADDGVHTAIIKAFTIERHRSFDQDPRLGLVALSEIASRALAPATNDPGTGIEVLNALLRVLLTLRPEAESGPHDGKVHAVHIEQPLMADMLTDAFGPIVREGGEEIEVSLRLTNTLAAMHANLPVARTEIEGWATRHANRVREAMADLQDLAAFERVYDRLWHALG